MEEAPFRVCDLRDDILVTNVQLLRIHPKGRHTGPCISMRCRERAGPPQVLGGRLLVLRFGHWPRWPVGLLSSAESLSGGNRESNCFLRDSVPETRTGC